MKEVNEKMDILTTTYLNGVKSIEMLYKTNLLLENFNKCTESINRAFEIENKLNSKLFQTSNYIQTALQTNANYFKALDSFCKPPIWLNEYGSALRQISKITENAQVLFQDTNIQKIFEETAKWQSIMSNISTPYLQFLNTFNKTLNKNIVNYESLQNSYIAINRLKFNSIVYFDDITEQSQEIIQVKDINSYVREYFSCENNDIFDKCLQNSFIKKQMNRFKPAISEYRAKEYTASISLLIPIIDGIMTYITNKNSTGIKERGQLILYKLENSQSVDKDELGYISLHSTIEYMINSFFASSNFEDNEPNNINRHWASHGRDSANYDLVEFTKVLRYLYGLVLVSEM